MDMINALRRQDDEVKFLEKSHPQSHTSAVITKWVNSLKLKVPQKKEMTEITAKIIAAADLIPVADRPKLEDVVADWGLTSKIAGKLSPADSALILAAIHVVVQ